MTWVQFLEEKFKNSFYEKYSNELTLFTNEYFPNITPNEDFFTCLKYWTSIIHYKRRFDEFEIMRMYDIMSKQNDIDLSFWKEIAEKLKKVSFQKNEAIYRNIMDIYFFDSIIDEISNVSSVTREQAVEKMNEAHLYEVAEETGMEFLHHYNKHYWTNEVLNFYKEAEILNEN